MKEQRLLFLLVSSTLFCAYICSDNSESPSNTIGESTIEIHAKKAGQQNSKKVKLLLGITEDPEKSENLFKGFSEKLSKNLEYGGQLEVSQRKFEHPKSKKEVIDFFDQGYPLVLFVNYLNKDNAVEWRLYDATQAEMVKGKKYGRTGQITPRWAHGVAQDLWPELSQEPGIFLTKIAYVKRLKGMSRKYRSQICLADFDGSNEKVLLDLPNIYVELSFHPDKNDPRLLVSEFTAEGARLIMLDFHGNKKVILGGDRSIMGASLSPKGDKAIYKDAGDIWRYRYDAKTRSANHEVVIRNKHKCSSATLCPNDDIIYCSDGKIYRYDAITGNSAKIIEDGIAPSYSPTQKKIAYSKRMGGTLQLMLHDEKSGTRTQLTFDSGNKSDSCFSPCGNYILFCHEKLNAKQIVSLALATRQRHKITLGQQYCSYPAWSPLYSDLLR